MADFEELKLTVTLQDDASAGLASIRAQLTQLTQTAGQVQTSLSSVASGAQQVGSAVQTAAPRISTAEKSLKELGRSAEETTRGLLQTVLAARRGAEAFPELALGLREAAQGFKGVNAGMAELAPAAATAIKMLGGIAIGVTAVGAAVVAYGVSVFKFSQEMYQLGQTARTLGVTFGALRNLTEQGEKFGVSADVVIRSLAGIQAAQTNLAQNNSPLRQQLIGQGLDPNWLNRFARETDEIKQQNMLRQKQIDVYNSHIAKGDTPMASRGFANQLMDSLGGDKGAMDRDALKPQTDEQKQMYKEIDENSRAIAKSWGEISGKISEIKTEFLAWGLPGVLTAVTNINSVFDKIVASVKWINEHWAASDKAITGGIQGGATKLNKLFGIDPSQLTDDELRAQGVEPARPRTERENRAIQENRATPSNRFDRFQPSSFRTGANDNSLLHRASFGGDDGGSGSGRAQEIIKGGVFDALVQFSNYIRTGGVGGGGGGSGIQNASLTTGNIPGAGGGVAGLHGGGGYNVMPNGAPAGADTSGVGAARGKVASGGDPRGMESYIRETAAKYGIDPDTAVAVAKSEGLGTFKSSIPGETSYGAFQLHTGGGMGDDFRKETGLDPSNPANERATIDYALKNAGKTGWGPFHGAANTGIGAWQGIRRAPPTMSNAEAAAANGYAGVGGYNFMGSERARAMGMGDVTPGSAAAQVDFPTGIPKGEGPASIKANKYGGSDMAGFLKDLHDAGAPLDSFSGVYANRGKRGGGGASQHAYGNAIDLESGFGSGPDNSSKLYAWAQAHPTEFAAIQAQHHMRNLDTSSGASMHDWGHFEWTPVDRTALNRPLDRSALNDNRSIHSTGKLDVNVNAPPGTNVRYHGQNLLKNTSMQRQTQMMPTQGGPSVGDTAQSYMRGGT